MKKYELSFEEAVDLYSVKKDFDTLEDYFTINNTITTKEGIFSDCTCNKCNIRAILGVDTMKKHVEACYKNNKGVLLSRKQGDSNSYKRGYISYLHM